MYLWVELSTMPRIIIYANIGVYIIYIYLYIFIYIIPNIAVGFKNRSIDIIGLAGKNNEKLCQYIVIGVKIIINYIPIYWVGYGHIFQNRK